MHNRPAKIWVSLLSLGLLVVMLLGLPLSAFSRTITDRDTVVALVSSETLYKELRKAANSWPLNQVAGDKNEASDADFQTFFDAGTLEPIIDQHLDLTSYQQNSRNVVGGFFAWLDGKTQNPEFTVTLDGDPAAFKNSVLDALLKRYHGFPACTSTQPAELEILYREQCRLPGLSESAIRTSLERELDRSTFKNLFRKATITSSEFDSRFSDSASDNARRAYGIARWLPWFVAGLLALFSGLVLLLAGGKRALKALGLRLLVPAGILLVSGLALRLGAARLSNIILRDPDLSTNETYLGLARATMHQLLIAVNNRWLLYSAVIAAVAGVLILAHRFVNKDAAKLEPPATT